MGANEQSWQHLSSAVLQPAEIISLGGEWGLYQVCREVVLEQWKQKRSAEWLDWFEAVLQALEVRLEIMAHVLWIAEGGTFEVHHIVLGGNRILATVAHNSDFLGLHQSLVVHLVSCWMEPGGRTGERLEMVAAKAGNYTLVMVVVLDEIDSLVARIDCHCLVYFHHHYMMLPHCHLGVVMSQTTHLVEPSWLSSVEIHSSTSYVNNRR